MRLLVMVLSFSLLINSTEYLPKYALPLTIRPVDSLRDRSDTMAGLKVRIPFSGDTPEIAIPKSGQEIVFKRGGSTYEFGGVIQRVRERQLGPQLYEYELACADYTRWFDRYLVQGVKYDEQVAGDVIKSIVSTYANKGTITWDVSLVEDGPTIPEQTFDFIPASQAIDQIAKLCGYRWDVDYQKRVVFTAADNTQAPIATIDCENDSGADTAGGLVLEDVADQVVNAVYVKDAKAPRDDQFTESLGKLADGSQPFFPLGFEPASLADVTVTANGTTYTVANGKLKEEGVDGNPGDGNTADLCYFCLPNWGIRFNTTHEPADGSTVTVQYTPLDGGPAVYRRDDPGSITDIAIREGTSGVYEEVISAPDQINVSKDAIYARADLILAQRRRKVVGHFTAYATTSDLADWRAGQYTQLVSSRRLGGLNQRMYVTEVGRRIVSADTMAFDIEIASDLYGEI